MAYKLLAHTIDDTPTARSSWRRLPLPAQRELEQHQVVEQLYATIL